MMTGHPVSSHIAPVIDFASPGNCRDEYVSEYNCSNCFHSFIVTSPTRSSTITTPDTYDSPYRDSYSYITGGKYQQFTLNTSTTASYMGSGYTNRVRGKGILNNRRKKTASLEDIVNRTESMTSTSKCELIEIDLELKEGVDG